MSVVILVWWLLLMIGMKCVFLVVVVLISVLTVLGVIGCVVNGSC